MYGNFIALYFLGVNFERNDGLKYFWFDDKCFRDSENYN
jgi:hypothetical protein